MNRKRARRSIFNGDVHSHRKSQRFSDALIKETKAVWEPLYRRCLSDEEASDIIRNACEFFGEFLIEDMQRNLKRRAE